MYYLESLLLISLGVLVILKLKSDSPWAKKPRISVVEPLGSTELVLPAADRPDFPAEIIARIASYCTLSSLLRLAVVNHVCNSEAERFIYTSIDSRLVQRKMPFTRLLLNIKAITRRSKTIESLYIGRLDKFREDFDLLGALLVRLLPSMIRLQRLAIFNKHIALENVDLMNTLMDCRPPLIYLRLLYSPRSNPTSISNLAKSLRDSPLATLTNLWLQLDTALSSQVTTTLKELSRHCRIHVHCSYRLTRFGVFVVLFPATPSIPVIPWLFPTSSAVPSINLKVVFPDLDDVEHITSILGSLAEAGPDLRTLTILSDARDLHLHPEVLAKCVSRFQHLKVLYLLHDMSSWDMLTLPSNEMRKFAAELSTGCATSNLRLIKFPDGSLSFRRRHRMRAWEYEAATA